MRQPLSFFADCPQFLAQELRAIRKKPSAFLAAALTTVMLMAGCAPAQDAGNGRWMALVRHDQNTSSAVVWSDCADKAAKLAGGRVNNVRYDCGTMRVPRNWAKPADSGTFNLALMRVRRNGQKNRIGSLLVNPGGPGASGMQLAAAAPSFLPLEIQRRFDIVGFDPRGVGESSPVHCFSDKQKDEITAQDPDPTAQQAFDDQVSLSSSIGRGCAEKYGDALKYYSTEQTAHDMDAIRQVVGDDKLSYLGYSYGTLLGQVYDHLFPHKIRATVLDGPVDPRQDAVASSSGQAAGFEQAFDAFAANCRDHGKACKIGPDARATVTQLLDAARKDPAVGEDGRKATAGYVMYAVISALYSKQSWSILEQALDSLKRGDPTGVFALADQYNERDSSGHYTNSIDANNAVNCSDETNPPSLAEIKNLQPQWRQQYPLFGTALAVSLMGCSTWAGGHDPYTVGAAEGSPPILVVGTTGDPATPYANAQKVAESLKNAVVLTWEGEGHTAYPQNKCINDVVNNYLINEKAPSHNVTCTANK